MVCDTELCFCRLCNFDLPNKQRFSLQKHKSCKKLRFLRYSACAEFLDNLLWLWHRALGVAQSFGFVAQSFVLAAFLQPWFVKETAFFFAKAQNLRIRLVPNSWIVCFGVWHRALLCGTELGEMVTLSVNILDNFTWNDGFKIFAWVWGGSYGGGQWIPCSGSGTTVNFDITDDLTAFLLVRCHKDTVTPEWGAAAGSAGEIYNKTNDITYISGQTSYNGGNWGKP